MCDVVEEGIAKIKPKRKLTILRRVYKNLYRNGRRRAAHTNSAEQQEGDWANEELPAGFSVATALEEPVTLQLPSGTSDKQFERREDEQNASRIVTIEHAVPEESERTERDTGSRRRSQVGLQWLCTDSSTKETNPFGRRRVTYS